MIGIIDILNKIPKNVGFKLKENREALEQPHILK